MWIYWNLLHVFLNLCFFSYGSVFVIAFSFSSVPETLIQYKSVWKHPDWVLPTLLGQICCQAPFTPQWWRSVFLRPDSYSGSALEYIRACFRAYESRADPLVLTLPQTGRRYAGPLLRALCTGLQCVQYAWVTLTPSAFALINSCLWTW